MLVPAKIGPVIALIVYTTVDTVTQLSELAATKVRKERDNNNEGAWNRNSQFIDMCLFHVIELPGNERSQPAKAAEEEEGGNVILILCGHSR